MESSNTRRYYREYYERAKQALSKDNVDYALDLLNDCLKREPAFAAARELLHDALRKKIKDKQVSPIKRIAARTQLAALTPSTKKITEKNIYLVLEKIERIIAQDPFNIGALELLAQVAHQANLIDTAISSYHEVLSLDEKRLSSIKALYEIYEKRDDLAKARQALNLAIRNYPDDPQIRKAAKNLDALGTIAEGQLQSEPRKTASAHVPEPKAPTPEPGTHTQTQGERIQKLKDQLKNNPSELFLRYQLGELLFQAGDTDGSIAQLQQAVSHPKRKVPALNLLGLCFKKKGMLDLAVSQFEKALSDGSVAGETKKEILYNLGTALEKMGQTQKASQAYKKIYELDIAYRDVAKKVEQYYRK